jgi:hypothetical protein
MVLDYNGEVAVEHAVQLDQAFRAPEKIFDFSVVHKQFQMRAVCYVHAGAINYS